MKQRDLVKKLENAGFIFERHGSNHKEKRIVIIHYLYDKVYNVMRMEKMK